MPTVQTLDNTTRRNPVSGAIVAFANRVGGSKSKEVERFLKFAMVGAMGAIVDVGTLVILQATILPPTRMLYVAVATTIAFLTAVTHNYFWNRFWTYPDSRTRSVRRQMTQFTIISVIGWTIRTIWISLAYLPLGLFLFPILQPVLESLLPTFAASPDAAERLGTVTAQLIGIAVIINWNFLANRLWTFNDVGKAEND